MIKTLIKDHPKLSAKLIAEKTGYHTNTLTNWNKADNDGKIPQDFILKMLQNFPEVNLLKYFPKHAEIISFYNRKK